MFFCPRIQGTNHVWVVKITLFVMILSNLRMFEVVVHFFVVGAMFAGLFGLSHQFIAGSIFLFSFSGSPYNNNKQALK